MLLRQLYELKHYNLVDGPLEWREALREGDNPGKLGIILDRQLVL